MKREEERERERERERVVEGEKGDEGIGEGPREGDGAWCPSSKALERPRCPFLPVAVIMAAYFIRRVIKFVVLELRRH